MTTCPGWLYGAPGLGRTGQTAPVAVNDTTRGPVPPPPAVVGADVGWPPPPPLPPPLPAAFPPPSAVVGPSLGAGVASVAGAPDIPASSLEPGWFRAPPAPDGCVPHAVRASVAAATRTIGARLDRVMSRR